MMALSAEIQNRLTNYKFRSAQSMVHEETDATDEERALVNALAIFGNPGWFLGGEMETILWAAIYSIVSEENR